MTDLTPLYAFRPDIHKPGRSKKRKWFSLRQQVRVVYTSGNTILYREKWGLKGVYIIFFLILAQKQRMLAAVQYIPPYPPHQTA